MTIHLRSPKGNRLLLGLNLLDLARTNPRHCFTQDEIAAWCGCTPQAISHIEKQAMQKLRYRLPKELLEV